MRRSGSKARGTVKAAAAGLEHGAARAPRYWIGVVGRRDSWERLTNRSELWWCVSPDAASGDLLAMYLTRAVPGTEPGVFAIYEISALDESRASECRGFGSHVTGLFNVFAELRLLSVVRPHLQLASLRGDALLRHSTFVRRSAQGTAFAVTKKEFERLRELCAAPA